MTLAFAVLAVFQPLTGVAPAAAQRSSIDPATLLPAVDDLPGQFVYRALPQESIEEPRARLALRMFERTNPGTPRSITRLVVTAAVATDAQIANGVLSSMRAQLEGRGWSFQRSNGLLGDEAFIGRLSVGGPTSRPVERIMVAFRKGSATGSADWEDFADLPNGDAALEVARIVEGRITTAVLDSAPTGSVVRPGLGPSSGADPTAGTTATPSSLSTPTVTPTPTSTAIVIRQLPR
jgi:hypothetical protein